MVNLKPSVRPCNKVEIQFRFVLSDQSAECFQRDQIKMNEGNNSDSQGELKQQLMKYLLPQAAPAF